jgi:hypothetical protein
MNIFRLFFGRNLIRGFFVTTFEEKKLEIQYDFEIFSHIACSRFSKILVTFDIIS